ncbi:Stk1 family PASTA domain-containing Ser/Thr kinase [Aestuariimicrobium ganziense]|uniref:Stk1 family PASTA domain-containing Ser/Thr kinase n=1 Tax=Aestuariimicrobium ganziense TaxID=2773677 RepID=UPI0019446B55|nr:Stk1 family PASTA domain-containing Ser/Thr kinase [Aestuariimicrobium ganziense]
MSSQGTVLGGRYRLDTVIGRGGMAEVWRAQDQRLDRLVAVKRLRTDLASDPMFLARFRREAHAAAGLNHPNIVSVYDTGEAIDEPSGLSVPYIVMELVEGHTLREVLRDGRKILPERALQFVQGVLDALAYSHKGGIVHRDIKPANVMLTKGGQVKVMDFGIARAVADTSATMTQTAAVIGTAQYLSPEQARGETVDHRSDIYSAGCLLYELLVGRPPFVGDSPVSVAYQHVRENPVPPSHLDPELTPAMDAVTLKALAKDPADRYQNASEMREDIARVLAGNEVTAVIPPPVVAVPEPAPTAVAPVVVSDDTNPSGFLNPVTTTQTAITERRRWGAGTWVLVTLLGLLLVALGFGAYQVLKPDPTPTVAMTTVPVVEGLEESAARATILNAKLQVGEIAYVNGPEDSKGKVIKQTPEKLASVPENTRINLTVNTGVKLVKVPDNLKGKTEKEVTDALTELGFTVARSDASPADTPADYDKGQVVSLDPASGAEVAEGSEVKITVATGKVQIPNDLSGKSEEDASKQLTDLGLKVKSEPTDGGEAGKVVSSDPEGGKVVEKGSEVTLKIGSGTPVIPGDLVGKTEREVTQILSRAGYEVVSKDPSETGTTEPTDAVAGQVLSVDPRSGSPLAKGQTVTITVATGKSAVPNLRGLTVERATQIAKNAGFTIKVTEQTSSQEAGKVFNQTPNDGQVVDRKTVIEVFVATQPEGGSSSSADESPTPGG